MKILNTFLNRFILSAFLAISIVGASSSARSQAPAFFSAIDDLPLMPGLYEEVDGALSFDTANGRIAEITALGTVEAGAVIDYYAWTLPQLGWKLESRNRYKREGEILSIDVEEINRDNAQVIVHFRFSPAGTK